MKSNELSGRLKLLSAEALKGKSEAEIVSRGEVDEHLLALPEGLGSIPATFKPTKMLCDI